jgi:hypothetical protein
MTISHKRSQRDQEASPIVSIWLPKLTVQSIGCHPEQAVILQKRIPICLFAGSITRTKDAPQQRFDTSPTKALIGDIEAIDLQGDPTVRYRSGIAYLPNQWQRCMLKMLDETSPKPVSFAYTFFAEPLRNDPKRWGYAAEMINIAGSD